MFRTKINGTKAITTRTLKLPKAGKLDAKTLEGTYTIEIEDLAGLDPKSLIGKAILKNFPKVLDNDLNARRKQWDNQSIKIWTEVGAALERDEMTEKKARALTQAAGKKITANWNEFDKKVAKPFTLSILESLAEMEAKKAKERIGKSKIKFSSEELKENRFNIWASIAGAAVFAAASSPLGWVAAGLSASVILGKGYSNAWQIAQKRSIDVETNLNNVKDGLETAQSALKKLEPHIKTLNAAQKSAAVETARAEMQLKKMLKELSDLEGRAKSEKAVKEGDYLAKLRKAVDSQSSKAEELRKTVEKQENLEKTLQSAVAAIDAATEEVSARRTGWDKVMEGYVKNSQDSNTLIDALSKLAKQLA